MAKKPNGNGAAKAAEAAAEAAAADPKAQATPPADAPKVDEAAPDAAKLAQPEPKADGQVEGTVGENTAGAAKLAQPEPAPDDDDSEFADDQPDPVPPAKRSGPQRGDRVAYRLAEGERPLNGQRRFPATVIGLCDDGRLDLKVHYGPTAGDGYRQGVPKGDAPGCWS